MRILRGETGEIRGGSRRRRIATFVVVTTLVAACGTGDADPVADGNGGNGGSGASPTPASAPTGPAGALPTRPDVVDLLADEPAVVPAEGEKFTNPGATLHHDGRWWMLRNSFTSYGQPSRTDLLVSDDLLTWSEVAEANPLFTTEDVPGTDGSVFAMSAVVDDDDTWVAYLYDFNGKRESGVVRRATAPAAAGPWTIDPEPVLTPGPEGAWDHLRVGEPQVVRDGERWLMWFTGYASAQTPDRAAIGLATSDDGVTWTKHDGPVLSGTQGWTQGSVSDARVVRDGDGFTMVYRTRARGAFGQGLATSPDGRTWTPWAGNPILVPDDLPNGNGMWQSALVADGNEVRYLLESGGGGEGTAVYPWAIDVEAARAADLPRIETDVSVSGSTVTIAVTVPGLELRFDPSDDAPVVHPHAFVDRVPTAAGKPIPLGIDAVVHARDGTLRITGLAPGAHTITVLLAGNDDLALDLPVPVIIEVSTT